MASDQHTAATGSPAIEQENRPFIRVSSVWKVFGRNPERVLDPQYAGEDKSFFQTEFGNVVGLQDVSFEVNRGETFVIMGLSGSGKSTMVRCLIRLIEPTVGDIEIDGQNITEMSDKELMEFRRGKIAMVFQHYGLQPHRNVLDNASWGLEVQGVSKPERYAKTREVLELVGLGGWEEAYPRQLSGGMQQRVGLARALAVDTDIMLMDEPFSGLDPLIRRQMQDELLRLQTDLHKTIVFITHDLNEASETRRPHRHHARRAGGANRLSGRHRAAPRGRVCRRLHPGRAPGKRPHRQQGYGHSQGHRDGTPGAAGRAAYHRQRRR